MKIHKMMRVSITLFIMMIKNPDINSLLLTRQRVTIQVGDKQNIRKFHLKSH